MLESRLRGVRWMRALVVAVTLAPSAAFAGIFPYELVFIAPTPLPPNVNEGSTFTVGVELQMGCDPFSQITWQATATSGTATAGIDFMQPTPSVLTFTGPIGRFVTFDLTIPDDLLAEGPETFDVRLTPMGMVDLDCDGGVPAAAPEFGITFTIIDDDLTPPLVFDIDDVQLMEGDTGSQMANFTVSLSGPPPLGQMMAVDFATQDGTATANGGDYQASAGQVVFPGGGPTTQTVSVLVNADTQVEPDETFTIQLSNPIGAILGDAVGEGTILNDDDPPVLPMASIDSVQIEEGDDPNNPGAARFRISLSEPSRGDVQIPFRTVAGTATAGEDFRMRQGTVVIASGELTSSVSVPILGDTRFEPDETFLVQLQDPIGATLGEANGRATIVNDDEEMQELPTLSIDDVEVTEGNGGTSNTVVRFTATLSFAADQPVGVPYQTMDGTAVAGEDYGARTGELLFAPGETTQPVSVPIIGDTRFEPDESFTVQLGAPQGATLERGVGTATILNDDEAPDLPMLRIADVAIEEGDSGARNATFAVSLEPVSEVDVRVQARTRAGTATEGTDFTAVDTALTIAAGESSTTVSVPVLGDTAVEDDETFFVILLQPVAAAIADAEGRGLIVDDDQPMVTPPTVSVVNARLQEGDEGARSAVFRVRLSAASDSPVQVGARTRDDTATVANQDYRGRAETLMIPPGQLQTTFFVAVLGDRNVEADERFTVEIGNPVGAVLGRAVGTGTIVNDDQETAPPPPPPAAGRVRLLSIPPTIEGDGRATVTVERVGALSQPAEVTVTVTAGSARAGQDFTAATRRVRWAAGEGGTRQFAFAVRDDNQPETDETVVVTLTQPVGVSLGSPARLEAVIIDNDTATRAEAIVDQEITSRTRREVELSVRTVRPDGTPVPGAPVRWRLVSGDAELLGNPQRRTDDEGITRLTVRLGRRPGKVVVAVELVGRDAELAFAIRVDGDFGDLVDPTQSPNDAELAGLLDGACTDAAEGDLAALCDFLFGLESDDERRRALAALRPDGAAALADRGLRGPRIQQRNVGARLQTLRGGQLRKTLDQLAISLRGQSLSVGGVRQAFGAPRDDQQWLARVDQILDSGGRDRQGGSTSGHGTIDDASPERAEQDPGGGTSTPASEPFDTGSSPWGVFVNGRISIGDAPNTRRQAGYDFETEGLTAGVDYQLNERFVIGGALGYLRSDTELGGGRGEIDVEGLSLSGYFTFYRQRFYIDGIVGFGRNEYQTSRVIVLPRAFRGSSRLVARADPDGNQLSANIGAGYDLLTGAVSLQGFVRVAYTRAEIDAYSEQGAGPLSLTFGDQEQDSLLTEAGVELSYPFSFGWGVLQPSLRLAYLRELADDSRDFEVGLQADPGRRRYRNRTDVPDRSFLNIGAALTATFVRGWASYLQYDTDAARDDFDVYTLSFGVRKQL